MLPICDYFIKFKGALKMELSLSTFEVKGVDFGKKTELKEGILIVNSLELENLLKEDADIEEVKINLAKPGDKKRVVHVLDVLKPVYKVDGRGSAFAGVLGEPVTVGTGKTHQLNGVTVMMTGNFEQASDPILRVRETIVDMSGYTAKYSPFSLLNHVVISIKTRKNIDLKRADQAVRVAGAKAASFLASKSVGLKPNKIENLSLKTFKPDLPKICVILQCASIGTLFDTYLYGRTVDGILPTLVHMNEMIDGAVTSDEYFYGGQRNPTYIYQDNPLVKELYHRSGVDLNFVGVVLTRGYYNTLADKRRAASYCAKLAQMLGADGAVITIESGGNSHTDAMLTCQECEKQGVNTVLIVGEMGDANSTDYSLVDYVPEANAMVSVGNREVLISIPEIDEVIGGETMMDTNTPCRNEQDIPLHNFLCVNSQVGAWNISMDSF